MIGTTRFDHLINDAAKILRAAEETEGRQRIALMETAVELLETAGSVSYAHVLRTVIDRETVEQKIRETPYVEAQP